MEGGGDMLGHVERKILVMRTWKVGASGERNLLLNLRSPRDCPSSGSSFAPVRVR